MKLNKNIVVFIGLFLFISNPCFSYTAFIQHVHDDIPKERAAAISQAVNQFSDYYDIPSDVIVSIMWRESKFVNAMSDVDRNPCSAGYMQVQRTTASAIYHQELSCHDLIVKWRLNIQLGVKYLRKMYDKTGHLAGAIGRYNGIHNLDYVRNVLNRRQKIKQWRRSH